MHNDDYDTTATDATESSPKVYPGHKRPGENGDNSIILPQAIPSDIATPQKINLHEESTPKKIKLKLPGEL